MRRNKAAGQLAADSGVIAHAKSPRPSLKAAHGVFMVELGGFKIPTRLSRAVFIRLDDLRAFKEQETASLAGPVECAGRGWWVSSGLDL